MFDLTRQEKWILVFLILSILLGLGVKYFGRPVIAVEEKASIQKIQPVNINKAAYKELVSLKGIGPKTAVRIIEYRETHGSFFYKEDIKNVEGIGPHKFDSIKDRITTK